MFEDSEYGINNWLLPSHNVRILGHYSEYTDQAYKRWIDDARGGKILSKPLDPEHVGQGFHRTCSSLTTSIDSHYV